VIVTIVTTENGIKSFSSIKEQRYMASRNTLELDTGSNILRIPHVRHFSIFSDNGVEIFSAQNVDKGFDK